LDYRQHLCEFNITMTSFIEEKSKMGYTTRLLGKRQDEGRTGEFINEAGETCQWMVGLDGHGQNTVIQFLRNSFDWDAAMRLPDSFQHVASEILLKCPRTKQTGTTYAEAKMFSNRIETCTCGDTEIFVYINGVMVYKSTPHNQENPAEMERLNARLASFNLCRVFDNNVPIILSETTLGSIQKPVFVYENGDRINMTQALGHDGITGYAPERNTIHFDESDTVVVIIGSDGLTEMICKEEIADMHRQSVHELANLAERRWQQEWTWKGWDHRAPERETITSFQDFDDILVMKWEKNPRADKMA